MRHYEIGKWGISFIFDFRGSVIPKAMVWAIPNAALAAGLTYVVSQYSHLQQLVDIDTLSISQVWQSYNWLIGFLLTFRTGQAYARWWEGGTLLQQARGEWFNAYSSCIAFSSTDKSRQAEVMHFHRLLATLMSLLYSCALYQISQTDAADFDIVDTARLDVESMQFLMKSTDKVEVILQWIQRLVVEQMGSGVVPIPAPVISRVFQELSRGVVNINNVRKICEFPFPFPYAQLSMVMLLVHFFLTPVLSALLLESWHWAALTSWVSVFALWSLNYVASEIECPFGDDENDLPMLAMQKYMNRTLLALLEPRAQTVPTADTDVQLVPEYEDTEWTKQLFEPGAALKRRMVTVCDDSPVMHSRDGEVDGSPANNPWHLSEQSGPSGTGAGILSRLAGRFSTSASRGVSGSSFSDHEAGLQRNNTASSGAGSQRGRCVSNMSRNVSGGSFPDHEATLQRNNTAGSGAGSQRGRGVSNMNRNVSGGGFSDHEAPVAHNNTNGSAGSPQLGTPRILPRIAGDFASENSSHMASVFDQDAASAKLCCSESVNGGDSFFSEVGIDMPPGEQEDQARKATVFLVDTGSESACPSEVESGHISPRGHLAPSQSSSSCSSILGPHHLGPGLGGELPTYRAGVSDTGTGQVRALPTVREEGEGSRISHETGSSHQSGGGIVLKCRTSEKPSASPIELRDQI